jgi:hypothetical protein
LKTRFGYPEFSTFVFRKRQAKNKRAKFQPHKKNGVLSAQFCASHVRSVKGAGATGVWFYLLESSLLKPPINIHKLKNFVTFIVQKIIYALISKIST